MYILVVVWGFLLYVYATYYRFPIEGAIHLFIEVYWGQIKEPNFHISFSSPSHLFLLIPLSLALLEAGLTQGALFDQMKPALGRHGLLDGHPFDDNGVPVQLDRLQFVHSGEASGEEGESVVGEADMAELLQRANGEGKVVQPVDAQVERA